MTENLIGQIILMFGLMMIGFIANKLRFIHEQTASDLSTIMLTFIGPALIIRSLQQEFKRETLQVILLVSIGTVILYILQIILAQLLFGKIEDRDMKRSAIFGSIYSNVGFIGLPLANSIFGEKGVFYSVIAIAIYNVFCWTHGMTLFRKGREPLGDKIKTILTNPNIIAITIGMFFFFNSVRLPELVNQGLAYLGNANTPLSMIIIGNSLANINFRKDLLDWSVLWTVLLRNLLFPVFAIVIFTLLGIRGLDYSAALLMAACPVGSMGVLFTLQVKGNTDYAVLSMGLSTILSIITIPLIFVISNLII